MRNFHNKNLKNKKAGFTLIETMVAISIFTMVVFVALAALFIVVDATKKAQSLKTVMNNLNFAFEDMTRTIKTGSIESVDETSGIIIVTNQEGTKIKYQLNADKQIESCPDGGTCQPLTAPAPELEIDKLIFTDLGANSKTDSKQSGVVMRVKGIAFPNQKNSTEFQLETAIVQRVLSE